MYELKAGGGGIGLGLAPRMYLHSELGRFGWVSLRNPFLRESFDDFKFQNSRLAKAFRESLHADQNSIPARVAVRIPSIMGNKELMGVGKRYFQGFRVISVCDSIF